MWHLSLALPSPAFPVSVHCMPLRVPEYQTLHTPMWRLARRGTSVLKDMVTSLKCQTRTQGLALTPKKLRSPCAWASNQRELSTPSTCQFQWYWNFFLKTVSNFKYKGRERIIQMFHGVWSTKSLKLSLLLYQPPLKTSKHFFCVCEHVNTKFHNSRLGRPCLALQKQMDEPPKVCWMSLFPPHVMA